MSGEHPRPRRPEHVGHPHQPLLLAHLLHEGGLQPADAAHPRPVLHRPELEDDLVDDREVLLEEERVQELEEHLLQELGVVHPRLRHLEDGRDQLGEEPALLLLGDLLLQPRLELVARRHPGDHRAPDLLHALQLQLEILGAHPREAEEVVGMAPQPRVEVLDDLVDRDLDLLVGEAVDLEALHHHVLEVVDRGAPELGHRVLALLLHVAQRDQGEGQELVRSQAGAEDELADPVTPELEGERGVLAEERLIEEVKVLLLHLEDQRTPALGVLADRGVRLLQILGVPALVVPVHADLLDALEQLEGERLRQLEPLPVLRVGERVGCDGGFGCGGQRARSLDRMWACPPPGSASATRPR